MKEYIADIKEITIPTVIRIQQNKSVELKNCITESIEVWWLKKDDTLGKKVHKKGVLFNGYTFDGTILTIPKNLFYKNCMCKYYRKVERREVKVSAKDFPFTTGKILDANFEITL